MYLSSRTVMINLFTIIVAGSTGWTELVEVNRMEVSSEAIRQLHGTGQSYLAARASKGDIHLINLNEKKVLNTYSEKTRFNPPIILDNDLHLYSFSKHSGSVSIYGGDKEKELYESADITNGDTLSSFYVEGSNKLHARTKKRNLLTFDISKKAFQLSTPERLSGTFAICGDILVKSVMSGDTNPGNNTPEIKSGICVMNLTDNSIISEWHAHEEMMTNLTISTDGTKVASCSGIVGQDYSTTPPKELVSDDNSAKVWETKTGKLLWESGQLSYPPGTVVFSDNEKYVLVTWKDELICVDYTRDVQHHWKSVEAISSSTFLGEDQLAIGLLNGEIVVLQIKEKAKE